MNDKKHDDFFDEKTGDVNQKEQELMNIVDSMDNAPENSVSVGDKISGKIVKIGGEDVFIDINLKNEAFIKKSELLTKEGEFTHSEGDTIENLFVVSNEDGEVKLSKNLSKHKAALQEFFDAMENEIPVEGRVTGINRGGFNVKVMGKQAFCPFSEIDINFVEKPEVYLTKTFDFIVKKVENRGRNIVLSRIPLLGDSLLKTVEKLKSYAKEKKTVKGTISKIVDFGLFVNIEGLEGLVHISEISWDRSDKIADNFKVGDEVECVVLKVTEKENIKDTKISLSIKQLGEDPWDAVEEKLKVGDSIEGKITRLASFGAFVLLAPGIEGLIHISELSWAKNVRKVSDVVSEGDKVTVNILGIDTIKKSVSCSLKDVNDDPFKNIEEKFPVGSTVEGKIASKTKYGYFIDITDTITGLLPLKNIAKDKKNINKGDTIEVKIAGIDSAQRRVSLSYGVNIVASSTGDTKEYFKKQYQKGDTSSSEFGDLLKKALNKK